MFHFVVVWLLYLAVVCASCVVYYFPCSVLNNKWMLVYGLVLMLDLLIEVL